MSVISVYVLDELGIEALAYAQNSLFIHSFIHSFTQLFVVVVIIVIIIIIIIITSSGLERRHAEPSYPAMLLRNERPAGMPVGQRLSMPL